jgi:hypothetical protein
MINFFFFASNTQPQVTAQDRGRAKLISYSMLYGMGPSAISQALGVDQTQASALHQSFVESMPDVWKWMKRWVVYTLGQMEFESTRIVYTRVKKLWNATLFSMALFLILTFTPFLTIALVRLSFGGIRRVEILTSMSDVINF